MHGQCGRYKVAKWLVGTEIITLTSLKLKASYDIKALDDIGVVMRPFGDVVTVILVVNIYVFGFLR